MSCSCHSELYDYWPFIVTHGMVLITIGAPYLDNAILSPVLLKSFMYLPSYDWHVLHTLMTVFPMQPVFHILICVEWHLLINMYEDMGYFHLCS